VKNYFKAWFNKIEPQDAAKKELAEARMALLTAQTGLEWAKSSVEYNQARIKRLEAFVGAGK
jgi:hypothetical protein